MVDEFQDTDPVQWQVIDRAFTGRSTLILIGASVAGKLLSPGAALPVGIVTAVTGVPILFWLVTRRAAGPSA